MIYRELEDFGKATRYLEDARAIHHKLGDSAGEAADLGSIALIYKELGDYENTMKYMREATKVQTGQKEQ